MYLHKFTLKYKDGKTEYYYKFCRYPKKTKIYKQCIDLLNKDILKRFSFETN